MHPDIIDPRELQRLLDAAGNALSAAEAHGTLAGLVCAAPGGEDAAGDVEHVMDTLGVDADTQEILLDALLALRRDIQRQLEGSGFEFQAAAADDSEPLPARVEALADWCRGFMLGLLAGGVRDAAALPAEAGEAARDLVELGQMGVEPGPYDESHERAIAEIEEYLRVAVQLIYDQLHAGGPEGPDAEGM